MRSYRVAIVLFAALIALLPALPHGAGSTASSALAATYPPRLDPVSATLRVPAPGARVRTTTREAPIINGSDDRTAVDDPTQGFARFRFVTHLELTLLNGDSALCTGTMIGPSVLLTNAHCLYQAEFGGFVDSIRATPAAAVDDAPYGSAFASEVSVPSGWELDEDPALDFGLVYFEGNPFPTLSGPFQPLAGAPDNTIIDSAIFALTAGYPGDKPWRSMWSTSPDDLAAYDDDFIYTDTDTMPGQSGSPFLSVHFFTPETIILGVHRGGYTSPDFAANVAVRIGKHTPVLQQWCTDHGCSFGVVTGPDPSYGQTPEPPPAPVASFTGTPPPAGSIGMLLSDDPAEAPALVTALGAAGCDAKLIAVAEGGRFKVYIPGAPAVVNASFPAPLPAKTPFFVRC